MPASCSGPAEVLPGQPATWEIEVTNASPETWLQQKRLQLNLGNHWLLADRRTVVVNDDARCRLPGRLPAGEKAVIIADRPAPRQARANIISKFDVVQEGCRWFKNAGSPTLLVPVRLPVAVLPPAGPRTPLSAPLCRPRRSDAVYDGRCSQR